MVDKSSANTALRGKKVEKWAKNVQNYSPIHRNSFYHGKIHSQKYTLKIGDFGPKTPDFEIKFQDFEKFSKFFPRKKAHMATAEHLCHAQT